MSRLVCGPPLFLADMNTNQGRTLFKELQLLRALIESILLQPRMAHGKNCIEKQAGIRGRSSHIVRLRAGAVFAAAKSIYHAAAHRKNLSRDVKMHGIVFKQLFRRA